MHRAQAIESIRAFNRFYTNIIGVVDRHILGSPFSLTEARILLEVYHNGGCNARAIKETLNVDEGYLSRTIDKLANQGLITKRRCQHDGRVLVLSLSSKGEKAFLKLNEESGAAIAGMLRHLSDQEVSEMLAHMRRIQDLLTKTGKSHAHQT